MNSQKPGILELLDLLHVDIYIECIYVYILLFLFTMIVKKKEGKFMEKKNCMFSFFKTQNIWLVLYFTSYVLFMYIFLLNMKTLQ